MSTTVVVLGTNFYEIIFNSILYLGKVNVGYVDTTHFTGVFSFVLGLVATSAIISIIHFRKPFITFKHWKFIFLGFLLLMLCLSTMYFTFFFNNLILWLHYNGPDPHNLIWALSKGLGFWMFLPLIFKKKEI